MRTFKSLKEMLNFNARAAQKQAPRVEPYLKAYLLHKDGQAEVSFHADEREAANVCWNLLGDHSGVLRKPEYDSCAGVLYVPGARLLRDNWEVPCARCRDELQLGQAKHWQRLSWCEPCYQKELDRILLMEQALEKIVLLLKNTFHAAQNVAAAFGYLDCGEDRCYADERNIIARFELPHFKQPARYCAGCETYVVAPEDRGKDFFNNSKFYNREGLPKDKHAMAFTVIDGVPFKI